MGHDVKNAAGQGQVILDLTAKPAPERQEVVLDLVSPQTPSSAAESMNHRQPPRVYFRILSDGAPFQPRSQVG